MHSRIFAGDVGCGWCLRRGPVADRIAVDDCHPTLRSETTQPAAARGNAAVSIPQCPIIGQQRRANPPPAPPSPRPPRRPTINVTVG